ncbi:unnamed protein product [Symbiodinium sp. CCMP2592]|nr:unnamed protein product [Symbiodinium sp. CCMP2592]
MPFAATELSHLAAFDRNKHWGSCVIALACLACLAMGDCHAVELAQQSHYEVLRTMGGCLLPTEVVAFRRPFPRTAFREFLCIDDHVSVQILSRAAALRKDPARDTRVFEQSHVAYAAVGLHPHPKKCQRNLHQATLLGADIDGLLNVLVGCWIHVLMYRRPALCILDQCFKDAARHPCDVVVRLSRRTMNELLAVSCIGPLLQTDLRVGWCGELFCMDASPTGAGLCAASVPATAVAELHRFAEQRGYYTKLEAPATATLRELGLETEPTYFDAEAPAPRLEIPLPRSLSEGILYDCCELFHEPRTWSLQHAALGLEVLRIPSSGGSEVRFNDLLQRVVFQELVSLALRGVVRDWHAGPPSVPFCSPYHPALRSAGFTASAPASAELAAARTTLGIRLGLLFCIIAFSGSFFSIEQPGSSLLFTLDCFKRALQCRGQLAEYCYCSFGCACKRSSVWLHNKPWMIDLPRECSCLMRASRFSTAGRFDANKISAFERCCTPSCMCLEVSEFLLQYPLPLVRQLAAGSLAAKSGLCKPFPLSALWGAPAVLESIAEDCMRSDFELYQPRAPHDDPEWIGELADSLPFREVLRYRFAKPNHINILEARMFKTFQKYLALRSPDSRSLSMLDSRVTVGAVAKGRSSSPALVRVLQGTLPYTLGGGLYNGALHVYSAQNRSDGPSRGKAVDPPTKELPLWFTELCQGRTYRFDLVVAAASVPRVAGRWLRLLLLLGGDIETNPGPALRSQRAPRGPLDLRSGFTRGAADRMAKCLDAFKVWVQSELWIPFSVLCSEPGPLALALRGYGLHLYSASFPRYLFVYAITAIQDAFPAYRQLMTPAWQIDKKWQSAEPGECRPVISVPIVQALTTLGLMWRWPRFVGVVLIGFLCMLHPSEYLPLTRGDLILPEDVFSKDRIAYVSVKNPKTARFARRQHCRLEDDSVLRFIEALFGPLPFDGRLYPGSMNTFRSQWNAVMQRLGIPYKKADKGVTPGVLRGSGATHLYLETEDLVKVAWRGRWARQKTVEFYLQEVAAQVVLQSLPPESRARIAGLAEFSSRVVEVYTRGVQPSKHPRSG